MFSGVLFEALQKELGLERLMLSCAGRTDKGVSSCGQVHAPSWPLSCPRMSGPVFVGHVFLHVASGVFARRHGCTEHGQPRSHSRLVGRTDRSPFPRNVQCQVEEIHLSLPSECSTAFPRDSDRPAGSRGSREQRIRCRCPYGTGGAGTSGRAETRLPCLRQRHTRRKRLRMYRSRLPCLRRGHRLEQRLSDIVVIPVSLRGSECCSAPAQRFVQNALPLLRRSWQIGFCDAWSVF